MTLTLCLDTTQKNLMLGLYRNQEPLETVSQSHASHRYHSAVMLPMIQELLRKHGVGIRQIDRLAVNHGPGSFTGIRTGLISCRILGQFADIELYAFNTFELIAAQPEFLGHSVTVMLNAYRQRHYSASLRADKSGMVEWIQEPVIENNTDFKFVSMDHLVIEDSLKSLLPIPSDHLPILLDEADYFSPQAMMFYLAHQSAGFAVQWQELLPMYLQQPHITTSKKKSTV